MDGGGGGGGGSGGGGSNSGGGGGGGAEGGLRSSFKRGNRARRSKSVGNELSGKRKIYKQELFG